VRNGTTGETGWVRASRMRERHTVFTNAAEEKRSFKKSVLSIPAKNIKNYTFDSRIPLVDRVKQVPDFLLNHWKKRDKRENYTAYMPSSEEITIIQDYLSMLPQLHQKVLKERLIGIYFVNNFHGSGLTDYILADTSNLYLIIIVNPRTLNTSLSQWLTLRENSCFMNNASRLRVEVDCGQELSGFMYVLLHEASHGVDYIMQYTPYPEIDLLQISDYKIGNRLFVDGVWKKYSQPTMENNFSLRNKITFYGFGRGPKLKIEDAIEVYKQLSDTAYISLYGSQSWAEDFAELVTFFHLTHKLNQPYEINCYENEKQIFNYNPMKSVKLKNRIKLIQSIYASN